MKLIFSENVLFINKIRHKSHARNFCGAFHHRLAMYFICNNAIIGYKNYHYFVRGE